jgi:hypothetical protein
VRLAALIFFLHSLAWAGPWGPGRWHFYAQLRESAEFADERFDADADRKPIRAVGGATQSYREALSDLYFEVGMAARLSLLLDWRFLSALWQVPQPSRVGVSDLFLGAKLILFDDEVSAAIQCGLWVPAGASTGSLPLGPGDLRGDFMLLLGKIFDRPSIFISAELGVRVRGSAKVSDQNGGTIQRQYSHEIRYAAAAGYTWQARRRGLAFLGISVKLEGAYAVDSPVDDPLGPLEPQAGTYLKLGPQVTWGIGRGVQLSLEGNTFVVGRALPAMSEVALALGWSH